MINDKWTVLFSQFRTRTEVRGVLSGMAPARMKALLPEPITLAGFATVRHLRRA